MLLAIMLAAVTCKPMPLPAPPARAPEVMAPYLARVLHDCFGTLSPLVARTTVGVDPLPSMAGSLFQYDDRDQLAAAVLVEPAFIAWAPSAWHLTVILGHEAVHIALAERRDELTLPASGEESAADLIAATSFPTGACLLADVYAWHLARPDAGQNDGLAVRLDALRPLCIAQRMLAAPR